MRTCYLNKGDVKKQWKHRILYSIVLEIDALYISLYTETISSILAEYILNRCCMLKHSTNLARTQGLCRAPQFQNRSSSWRRRNTCPSDSRNTLSSEVDLQIFHRRWRLQREVSAKLPLWMSSWPNPMRLSLSLHHGSLCESNPLSTPCPCCLIREQANGRKRQTCWKLHSNSVIMILHRIDIRNC